MGVLRRALVIYLEKLFHRRASKYAVLPRKSKVKQGYVSPMTGPEKQRHMASFRDPRGFVFEQGGRLFRRIRAAARTEFEAAEATGLLSDWQAAGKLVGYKDVSPDGDDRIIELNRVEIVTYPYEWPFQALKDAALLHLDMLIEGVANNLAATDSSAYNIQFKGARPVFIDQLSWRPYREGEVWAGHGQFCRQFLFPLLLQAYGHVAYNAWYRGEMDGLPGADVLRALPHWRRFQPKLFTQLVLPTWFEKRAAGKLGAPISGALAEPRLPKTAYEGMLRSLSSWISDLDVPGGETAWTGYAADNSYSEEGAAVKEAFVAKAVGAHTPESLWDLGCNTGRYAEIVLKNGTRSVIGFESDPRAADLGFRQAKRTGAHFLPLVQSLTNPSPAQGWRQRERMGLAERRAPDFVQALALVHHLRLHGNVPLDEIVGWIIGLAPRGIIEFVPKSDPMCQRMLRHREGLFDDYSRENFISLVDSMAHVHDRVSVPDSDRELILFERRKLRID